MKITIRNLFLFVVLALLAASCMDEYTEEFTANKPVYMTYENLRSSVKYSEARDLKNPGKIYFKDDLLFVNEELEGVHVISLANPQNPQNIGFIEIPGNVDIAIKNNSLYADSYVDLVVIDISDVNNPYEVSREKDVFPYTLPPFDEDYRVAEINEDLGVVTGWEISRVRQEMEYHYYPVYYGYRNDALMLDAAYSMGGAVPQGSTFGVGGSMARFGLYNNYLYTVDQSTLFMFDVSDDASPKDIGKQNVGWNVETMFIYDGHMFFGTQSGMRIFSLEVPTVPTYVSDFWHVTSCDPVVVSNGFAYVTLRGGTVCGSTTNRLDVLQLNSDYTNTTLLASYPLHGPYGLGIDDEILFVCDGDAGLKVYNASDKQNITSNQISAFPGINAYDVIPVNGYLFMIGDDGFYFYDYSDLQNIHQLGFIPVVSDN